MVVMLSMGSLIVWHSHDLRTKHLHIAHHSAPLKQPTVVHQIQNLQIHKQKRDVNVWAEKGVIYEHLVLTSAKQFELHAR